MSAIAKWESVTLGELAEFRNGVNYNKNSFGTGIKVVGVKDFQDYTKPKFETLEEINPEGIVTEKSILHHGDIVFVRSNGNRELIGRSLFIENPPEDITHSAFSIRLRFISEKVYPRFYAYVFRTSLIRQSLSLHGGGTNISNLNQDILSRLEVPLPDLPTQRKIAGILSTYDDLIENNLRRIKILEEMAQSLYREWFVHFRFPGHESVKMVDSSLGLIPEGWEVKPIGGLLEHYIGGGWGKELKDDKHTEQAHVIRGTDIPKVRLSNVESVPCRFHKESNLRTRKLQHADIVFEVSGGSKGQPVGRSLFIHEIILQKLADADCMCASFCKLIRSDSSSISPELIYYHLLEIYSNGKIDKYQVQSTGITNFKFTPFLEQELVLQPPQDIQTLWNDKIRPLMKQINSLGSRNQNLRATRDLLLPKLLTPPIL